jgi:hypothetical protein
MAQLVPLEHPVPHLKELLVLLARQVLLEDREQQVQRVLLVLQVLQESQESQEPQALLDQ